MSRTGLYDCHNFKTFVDDIMRDSNFGMGVVHVKVKYWRIFCDVISLLARVFIVSFDRAYKEVSTKKYWKFSVAQFLWYDCTLQKPMYRPCDLDLWPMKVNYFLWIDYQPISVLYKFEINTSTNSREIKYLNIKIWVLAFYMLNGTHVKNDVK